MNLRCWGVLCAGLLLAFTPQGGGARAQETAWRGMGAAPCTDFLKEITRDPSFENEFFSWAEGFMSGINADRIFSDVRTANLSGRPLEDQKKHVRDFCRAKPDHPYVQAVMDLYFTLPGARLDE